MIPIAEPVIEEELENVIKLLKVDRYHQKGNLSRNLLIKDGDTFTGEDTRHKKIKQLVEDIEKSVTLNIIYWNCPLFRFFYLPLSMYIMENSFHANKKDIELYCKHRVKI